MLYKENKKALRIHVIYILPSDCVCNHGAANFACKKSYIIIITEIFLLHSQAGNSRRLIGVLTKAEQKKPPKGKWLLKNVMMNYSWYTVDVIAKFFSLYKYQNTTLQYILQNTAYVNDIIHEKWICIYMRIDVFTTIYKYLCVYERK